MLALALACESELQSELVWLSGLVLENGAFGVAGSDGPSSEAVERARLLLRDATERLATTEVEIGSAPPRRRNG